ncbi:MAG: hypothetical protein U5K37_02750 [Natrialbaceae archaeon]|nr:hypothetical protein [Natrialbaceae archaeon]
MTILSLHFWTAIIIFTLFLTATVLVWRDVFSMSHVTGALVVATLAVPVHVTLSPVIIAHYTPVLQTLQYAVTLVLIASIAIVLLISPGLQADRGVSISAGSSGVLLLALVVLGRRSVMTVTGGLDALYILSAVGLGTALIATAVVNRRARAGTNSLQA